MRDGATRRSFLYHLNFSCFHPNMMNLLRPSPRIRYYFLIILTVLGVSYSFFWLIDGIMYLDMIVVKLKSILLSRFFHLLLSRLGCCCGVIIAAIFALFDQSILGLGNMMMPSGGSGATWKEDTREIDVLLESFSETDETGSSVNQPVAPPVPPANPVASPGEEAGPANQVPPMVPYPYRPDEIIGGDSVDAIQRRLLARYNFPSYEQIQFARIDAEDRFEVKVDIIQIMAGLDPTGNWMGRGARALDNPRTATGEPSLEQLYALLEDLNRGGVQSATFADFKNRIIFEPGEGDGDAHSST